MLYRLRTSLAYRYFGFATRRLPATPRIRVERHAPCEVHTMLGAHDLRMYLLAIKSLASFAPEDLSVVVHSDGTLTDRHRRELERHIDGVRFVDFDQADRRATERLSGYPLLHTWRRTDAAYRRLIDVELWREAGRVIVLDSDVLTSSRPDEVIAWMRNGHRAFLLGQPPVAGTEQPARPSAHVQRSFLDSVPALSSRLRWPERFLQGTTAGFCGYTSEISLESMDAALRESLALGLPMQQWGGDQCLVIFLLSVGNGERLPADRYLNFDPTVRHEAERARAVHFYGTHRFHGMVYPRLAARAVQRLEAAG